MNSYNDGLDIGNDRLDGRLKRHDQVTEMKGPREEEEPL